MCAVTRSGTNIYHAHAVKARTTKEILQRPGVKFRLVELRELRRKFPKSRTETVDLAEDVDWPASVQRISASIVPEGLTFPDIGDDDPCRCVGDCFMDSCHNALLSIYCTPETCSLGGDCCNSPRTHPALKLYDTCHPNVEFVEMQNGANVKVLAKMIKTVLPGTQLTVNYGADIWFKCACDSCWIDVTS
eukprot:jgi/Phyca11/101217/e_gw1.5.457.1